MPAFPHSYSVLYITYLYCLYFIPSCLQGRKTGGPSTAILVVDRIILLISQVAPFPRPSVYQMSRFWTTEPSTWTCLTIAMTFCGAVKRGRRWWKHGSLTTGHGKGSCIIEFGVLQHNTVSLHVVKKLRLSALLDLPRKKKEKVSVRMYLF